MRLHAELVKNCSLRRNTGDLKLCVDETSTMNEASAKDPLSQVGHPEPVEGSVQAPLRKASGTDPSASLGVTKASSFRAILTAVMLSLLSGIASFAHAEDWTTTDGKVYKDVK
jgi:hypothetical protein